MVQASVCPWSASLRVPVLVLALVAALLQAGSSKQEKKEKKRELYEIASGNKDVGLDPFYEGNMEPFGAVCIAYLNEGSANHKMLKKLAAHTNETDPELFDLQVPMAGALDWYEKESIQMVRRAYGNPLWETLNMSLWDDKPVDFVAKPGRPWKEKEVRKWLMQEAFPMMNYRVHGYKGNKEKFPFQKYFGKGNKGGVGLLLLKIGTSWDFQPQFQKTRALRPYIEQLTANQNIRFTVLEKAKSTMANRKTLKFGLDNSIEAELVLVDDVGKMIHQEKVDNYYHGYPKKYRLTNFSESAVEEFFDSYYARLLPTYWASSEEEDRKKKRKYGHLMSWNFETFVYHTVNHSQGVLVAFFNDNPDHGCKECKRGREVWDEVEREVKGTKERKKRLVIASLDQSANEHSEVLVPNKLAQPIIVWYPPGTPEKRKKGKRVLHSVTKFSQEPLLKTIDNLIDDLEDEEREREEL